MPFAARGGPAAESRNPAAAPVTRAQRRCGFTGGAVCALGQGRGRANAGASGLSLGLLPHRKPRRRVRLPLAAMSEGARS